MNFVKAVKELLSHKTTKVERWLIVICTLGLSVLGTVRLENVSLHESWITREKRCLEDFTNFLNITGSRAIKYYPVFKPLKRVLEDRLLCIFYDRILTPRISRCLNCSAIQLQLNRT